MSSRSATLVGLLAMSWIAVVGQMDSEIVRAATVAAEQRTVEITFRDGKHLRGTLDGVGCSESLCSRVAVRGREVGASDMNSRRRRTERHTASSWCTKPE